MPIYELGEVLIALQRIVHKAHLHETDRYEPGAKLRPEERRKLALCIGDRKRGSDLYHIYQFLTDPEGLDLAKNLIPMAIYGIAAYALGRVVSRRTGTSNQGRDPDSLFAASIYKEVFIFTDRLGNVGGVTEIDISSPAVPLPQPIRIDRSTRDYIHSLTNEVAYGRPVDLRGTVIRLLTRQDAIDVEIGRREKARIFMTEGLFNRVRFSRAGDFVRLRARPRLRFGAHARRLREFEAEAVLEIGREPNTDD